MTNTIDNIWVADSSCFLVHKETKFIMGDSLYLGNEDSIDNYEDQEYTEESYKKFYHDLMRKAPNETDDEYAEYLNTLNTADEIQYVNFEMHEDIEEMHFDPSTF